MCLGALSCFVHPRETRDGGLFIAMAYYGEESLRARIARGPLPLADTLGITQQIADRLDAAHRRSIVHRDIKPANILITAHGMAKIVDFGIGSSGTTTTSAARWSTRSTAGTSTKLVGWGRRSSASGSRVASSPRDAGTWIASSPRTGCARNPEAPARLLVSHGVMTTMQGAPTEAAPGFEEARRLFRDAGDERSVALTLNHPS